MSTYAIGDLQGCLGDLLRLLDHIGPGSEDRLWFVGDLVNRGPDSLGTLRFVRDLGDRAITVLGNHDLHLLGVAFAANGRMRKKDTLEPILQSPDRDALLDWLRTRPLIHHDPLLEFTLVHAGLPLTWSIEEARIRARELEDVLHAPDYAKFLQHMYGSQPDRWDPTLKGWNRLRFITNALTRMRYCTADGAIVMTDKGPPGTQPEGCLPWFELPGRASRSRRILFGHWSTLQLRSAVSPEHDVFPLDDGCLWGRRLSALRLEDLTRFHVPCGNERT